MSNISYFGRLYKSQVWKDLLEGYGFYKLDSHAYCIICVDLGFIQKQICYTDVNLEYTGKGDWVKQYEKSLADQQQRTFCKYHLYMMYAEGVTDNP